MGLLAREAQRIWKWSAVGGRKFSKATQYYTALSILRGQRKQGMCFEVVEVSGIRGVRDKWIKCSKQALAEILGSMEYLMTAVRGLLSYAESQQR